MVGWLVQNQKIDLGENQFCKRESCTLAAAQVANQFLRVFVAKQEECKRTANIIFGQVRICVPQFVQYRGFFVKVLVFLVVVRHVNIGTKFDVTRIGLQFADKYFHQGRLAATVGARKENAFAFLD